MKRLEKKQDRNYIRMLCAILNKPWKQLSTKQQVYVHLQPNLQTIQKRQTRHAGHFGRSKDKLIRDILHWTPTHGHTSTGQPFWFTDSIDFPGSVSLSLSLSLNPSISSISPVSSSKLHLESAKSWLPLSFIIVILVQYMHRSSLL